MGKLNRIYELHKLLSTAHNPIKKAALVEKLECSRATVERCIEEMRDFYAAPIIYDKHAQGYFYDQKSETKFELPGVWFNESELYGLVISHQFLSDVGSDLLAPHIKPIMNKLESLIQPKSKVKQDVANRVRILQMATRTHSNQFFSSIADAVLNRQRLKIEYQSRDQLGLVQRVISPQTLISYRGNWYVDAWCHLREQLRTFSLNRITICKLTEIAAKEVDALSLKEHFTTAYGIFSGKADKMAVLHFSKSISKWAAEEQWHPDQKAKFLENDIYELQIPYHDHRELIQDILKLGADVEIIEPIELREALIKKINALKNKYNE